jgi:hypothetical protein
LWETCADTTPTDWRNLRLFLGALLIWAICFAGVSQLIKREVIAPGPLAWGLATLPLWAGILVMFAYGRFLSQADELQRLIHYRSLAFGFGCTFFALAGYRVFERLGAPPLELANVTLLMSVLYTVSLLAGMWRYR